MAQHRVFSTTALTSGARVELTGEQAHYLGNVLRLKPDDPVVLFDLHGLDFSCTVVNITRNSVMLQVGTASAPATESRLNAWLVQGVVRGERMDYCVQKTTELGVKKILPVFTARSVVRLSAERAQKRMQHWEKVAISACEQSGRVTPPTIHAPQSLERLLANDLPEVATLVCLQPGTAPAPLNDIAHDNSRPLVLMVGPEGGFDEREQEILHARGAHMVTMGPRVLRSETAGIVGLALCQSVWGDF